MEVKNREVLAFKIDCEWLCNFVRKRVFYEDLSFEKGLELLESSFGIDRNTAFDILSGRKKIIGINEGELVDDDQLQEYLDFIKRGEDKKFYDRIEEELLSNPYKYLDEFAICWSKSGFDNFLDSKNLILCYDSINQYFNRPPAESYLQGGLYSISHSFVKEIIRTQEDKDKFYHNLYLYWEQRLKAGDIPEEAIPAVRSRQRNYLASLNSKAQKVEDPDLSETKTFNLCDGSIIYGKDKYKYVPVDPGNFSTYGLISPTGDFYACTWASHKLAAKILCFQLNYFGPEDSEWDFYLDDKAKDILYDRGWVFVNTCGAGQFYSKWGELENMPQRQMDTAFDYRYWSITDGKGKS